MKVQKPAGFWLRLLSRTIDFIFIVIISTLFLFLFKKNEHNYQFAQPWMFYVWALITIFSFILFMVIIPSLWRGKSIGMFIVRIEVKPLKGSLWLAIIKRELFFGIAWALVALMTMAIINHTLILKASIIKNKKSLDNLTNWERIRITFCGSISGLISFAQMWLAITIIPNKDNRGWHDRYAKCKVVRKNTYIKEEKKNKTTIIEPQKIKQEKVEWIK